MATGKLVVTRIMMHDRESWTAGPAIFMALAANESAAKRWIQDEVDGKHNPNPRSYMAGMTAEWWIQRGTFSLHEEEVHG